MPSNRYEHKSEALWQRYHDKKIDHDKYMELLEELKNNELKHFSALAHAEVESDIWSYEKQRQKVRQLEAEQEAEAERIKKLPPLERYKETIQETVAHYRKESNRYRNIHNFFQGGYHYWFCPRYQRN
jgi:predicted Zn-dependent protease